MRAFIEKRPWYIRVVSYKLATRDLAVRRDKRTNVCFNPGV